MRTYRHYSFDLWLTLIKSNPVFKPQRTKIFHQRFNPLGKTLDEVAAIFRHIDVMCNSINETTGKNIDAEEMYLMVISTISDFSTELRDIDIKAIYSEMENLLLENLPLVYCDETIPLLSYLKENVPCSISILSNTGFIRGQTLRTVLKEIGLLKYFDFQLYSDEAGMSKPNPEFFKLMLSEVSLLQEDCALEDIIHIGDNPKADTEGAKAAGIQSLLINSNSSSINSLLCKEYQAILSTK